MPRTPAPAPSRIDLPPGPAPSDPAHELALANDRLAVHFTKIYARFARTLDFSDLLQEARIGLLTAARHYDPARGARFSTYAGWWIKSYLRSALRCDSGPVHLPHWLFVALSQYRREAGSSDHVPADLPEFAAVCDRLGWKAGKRERFRAALAVMSAGTTSDGDDGTFLDDLPARGTDGDDVTADDLLRRLSADDADLLRRRYGIGCEPETLREAARRLGCSHQYVSNRQAAAEAELRQTARHVA